MTAVPHAISRKALTELGSALLAVPPAAQALAAGKGLKIVSAGSVNVHVKNRIRGGNSGQNNPVARMIIGDHVEALRALMAKQGNRLGFQDRVRNRSSLEGS
ncbi:hypothetical protein D3C75_1145850 [compost metagenome]